MRLVEAASITPTKKHAKHNRAEEVRNVGKYENNIIAIPEIIIDEEDKNLLPNRFTILPVVILPIVYSVAPSSMKREASPMEIRNSSL
jgi:hypothetical protein